MVKIAAAVAAAPRHLAATSPAVGTAILNWTENSDNETRFDLAGDNSKTVVKSFGANVVTAATFTGLNPGVSYHFCVRDCTAIGYPQRLGLFGKTPDDSDDIPAILSKVVATSDRIGPTVWLLVGNSTSRYSANVGKSALSVEVLDTGGADLKVHSSLADTNRGDVVNSRNLNILQSHRGKQPTVKVSILDSGGAKLSVSTRVH